MNTKEITILIIALLIAGVVGAFLIWKSANNPSSKDINIAVSNDSSSTSSYTDSRNSGNSTSTTNNLEWGSLSDYL